MTYTKNCYSRLIFICLCICFAPESYAQYQPANAVWDNVQNKIQHMDSMALSLKRYKHKVKSGKAKYVMYAEGTQRIKLKKKVKYKKGNVIVYEKYSQKKVLLIKVHKLNDEIKLLSIKHKLGVDSVFKKFSSTFTNLGGKTGSGHTAPSKTVA